MANNLVAQVGKAGGDFELVEREIPAPAAGEVRIKVQACGVCHSDAATKYGAFPFITYPRVPGHEVAGVIDEIGAGGGGGEKRDPVGAGGPGGEFFVCESFPRGGGFFREKKRIKRGGRGG